MNIFINSSLLFSRSLQLDSTNILFREILVYKSNWNYKNEGGKTQYL